MKRSVRERYEKLQVEALLRKHTGLRIVPSRNGKLVLKGSLRFTVTSPSSETISDQYDVELCVPSTFPADEPTVRETGGRIPSHYHKLKRDYLCLGAPTEIRITLRQFPTLPTFVDQLVDLFCAKSSNRPEEFLCLTGMKKRVANKHPCPCGSGRRLGRCHCRRVNHLRRTIGRTWFRAEYQRVVGLRKDMEES